MIPEHRTYVEAFGGGGSMLLAKEPSEIEVYNDLNSGLVNFFRVLRDNIGFKEFQRLVSLTPYSREEYEAFRNDWEKDEDRIGRAHKWFAVARMSFGGMFGNSFGFSRESSSRGMAQCVSAWLGAIERLPEVCQRILRVIIENKDALDLIKTFDSPKTFFYLDPPYVLSTRKSGGYKHELSNEDHQSLINLLLKLKGKVMLSGYKNPIYKKLEESGWNRRDFNVQLQASGKTRSTKATTKKARVESVWMNYEPAT